MPQTGVVQLTVNAYPKGQDMTQRREKAYGTAVLASSSAAPIAITSFQVATNVITFQAVNSLAGTETITVSGFVSGNAYANGVYAISSATGTTIVAALIHANAGPITAAGSAVLTPEYVTGGLPIAWGSMIDGNFGKAPYMGTWGPLQTAPKKASFYSTGGGLTTIPGYQYIFDTVNNTLRILSSGTELTNAATITPDTIAFDAEFIKNGF